MTPELIILIIVLVFLLISLYKEIFLPATTFFIAIVILSIAGILEPKEVLNGFANEQIAVIILLILIGNIIKHSTFVENFFDRLFKAVKTYNGFLIRMMAYVSGASAFLNNTPLVAMLLPYVYKWGKNNKISPSKLLMPLSFAAILGGTATLIGTSTNLFTNGLAVEYGEAPLKLFDFTLVGLPMIIIGILYILFIGKRLLPDKRDVMAEFKEKSREYLVETRVEPNSSLIGKSVRENKLRKLPGLFLVELIRERETIDAVSPNEKIEEGDRLLFAGATESVTDLIKTNIGLTIPKFEGISDQQQLDVVEVVITYNSPLINKTVKETNFRSLYDGAIIAIHRNNERLRGKIGRVKLRPGDVLLILVGKDFLNRLDEDSDMHLISQINPVSLVDGKKANFLAFGLLVAVAMAAFEIVTLFQGLMVLLLAIVIFRIVPVLELRKSLDLNLLIICALALALGKAMVNTHAADIVANAMLSLTQPIGVIGLLFTLYFITTILAGYLTNKAAVSIILPISLSIGQAMDVGTMAPFILVVAFAAAATFITPIGYQTNLMVYGPGRYSFKDFLKVGFPLTIIYMVTCVTILSIIYKLN
ncbi:MAG: SLC13 family permease [Bacteroidetes bacterium]|nr:SLC13 family permease [Bacteroidota bacterium]